jgi:hypothetical protein
MSRRGSERVKGARIEDAGDQIQEGDDAKGDQNGGKDGDNFKDCAESEKKKKK